MSKAFNRSWRTSTKLFTLARFIEKNRTRFDMGNDFSCVFGMATELVRCFLHSDYADIIGITKQEQKAIYFGKFSLIDSQFPVIKIHNYTNTKLPCEVLRFLAREYRKRGS